MTAMDRNRVTVGDEFNVTVRVASPSPDPVQVILPQLNGLELVGRTERSEVSYGAGTKRVTTVTFALRAATKGRWRIGPVQVRQGTQVVLGDAIDITVEQGAIAAAGGLPPRLAKLLQRANPPTGSPAAALTLELSTGSAVVGEQVDVVTIAWFQRELRQQLRRSPTVEAPRIEGVWSYPQPVPAGIAASRLVGKHWYDLFILHQVVFPLTPGLVKVSPARLHYSVPLAFQFFSQEERYSVASGSGSLSVSAIPAQGRPADFTGAVAHGLTLSQSVSLSTVQQGEALTARVTLRGEGNVALWPAPAIHWPAGVRAYPDATEEQVSAAGGWLGGTKTFRYLLVPDSAGTMALAPIGYNYFDAATSTYLSASAGGLSVPVAPRAPGALVRATPPALLTGVRPNLTRQTRHALPDAVWLVVLLLGPAGFLVRSVRLPQRTVAAKPPSSDSLVAVERELTRVVGALSAGAEGSGPGAVEAALRRSGLSEKDARQALVLRERLRANRFGGEGLDPTLLAEARALVRRIRPEGGRSGPRWRAGTAALLLIGVVHSADAQSLSPEQLYDAGALNSAEDGFTSRTVVAPGVGANWYNLGATKFRLGDDGGALSAWTRAARLLPRENSIRRALVLVPPANSASARQLWVSPVTPDELWLAAALAWLVGWSGLAWRRRVKGRWLVPIVVGAMLGGSAAVIDWWYGRPIAVVLAEQPMLLSPSERAPQVGVLPRSSTVLVRETAQHWALVQDPQGNKGWAEQSLLAKVSSGN
jgi:hypothetical protein